MCVNKKKSYSNISDLAQILNINTLLAKQRVTEDTFKLVIYNLTYSLFTQHWKFKNIFS